MRNNGDRNPGAPEWNGGKSAVELRRPSKIRPEIWLLLSLAALAVLIPLIPLRAWLIFWKAIAARKFLVSMSLLFGLIALSIVWAAGQRIDVAVFLLINSRGSRPRWLDQGMLYLTLLGNGLFAYACAVLFWAMNHRMLACELVMGNLTLWLMVELLKVLLKRQRPYSFLSNIRILGPRERGNSFPSGHTSQAFFMASLLSHYFFPGFLAAILLYTLALCVGITRMYVGMHYPRDVLGGIILGTSWGLVGVSINSYVLGRFFLGFLSFLPAAFFNLF